MAGTHLQKQSEVTAPEVRTQLALILKSKIFGGERNASEPTRPAQVLEYIVERTLNNKPLSGNDILRDVFKKSVTKGSNDAKVAANTVRRYLLEYYGSTGVADAVEISIPRGRYKAHFKYSTRSFAQSEIRRGLLLVSLESPALTKDALLHFEAAIKAEPELADAYIGKAAALLTRTLHSFRESPVELFTQAEAAVDKARKLNPKSWGATVQLGAIHLFRHQWKLADREYAVAKASDALALYEQGSYGPYLLSRGHYVEADELIRLYRSEYTNNTTFLRRAALYLYVLRRYDEAEQLSLELIKLPVHLYLSHLNLVFTYLAANEVFAALSHMRFVASHAGFDMWPGLYVLCLAKAGESMAANQQFLKLREAAVDGYIQPMQFALAYLALGQLQECIRQLSDACDQGDPFTAWLHLWPFLDPIRSYPEFQELLRKWKFPAPL